MWVAIAIFITNHREDFDEVDVFWTTIEAAKKVTLEEITQQSAEESNNTLWEDHLESVNESITLWGHLESESHLESSEESPWEGFLVFSLNEKHLHIPATASYLFGNKEKWQQEFLMVEDFVQKKNFLIQDINSNNIVIVKFKFDESSKVLEILNSLFFEDDLGNGQYGRIEPVYNARGIYLILLKPGENLSSIISFLSLDLDLNDSFTLTRLYAIKIDLLASN
ncbi:14665_t:CDS:2, partial [Gigaspora rosea]